MAVDLTNSLEYKRIADTYKSVLFVDSTNTSHVSCYTGDGHILPWEFNNNGMQFYGKHIACDSLITNNISSITTQCTSTITCSTLTINSNNGKIVGEITDDDNCGVTDKYVIQKFADVLNTKIDIDTLSSDVGVSMINVGADNNVSSSSLKALLWVFDAPNYQKHYYVIIVPLCVYVTNDFTFTLNLNGTSIASTRIKNNTNHGDRLIVGWANSTFIHTLPANSGILKGTDNKLTVTMNGDTRCVKKNILILNGE